MKLEDIQTLWDEDTQIDRINLSNEVLKIASLHAKYYRIYVQESLQLKKLESDYKILKLEKYEFYTQGPSEETHKKGWKLPPCGKILKTEVQNYIEADKDLIALLLKISIQKEKADFVKAILSSLSERGYALNSAIKFEIFKAGG